MIRYCRTWIGFAQFRLVADAATNRRATAVVVNMGASSSVPQLPVAFASVLIAAAGINRSTALQQGKLPWPN
jgi:hypothetical protein